MPPLGVDTSPSLLLGFAFDLFGAAQHLYVAAAAGSPLTHGGFMLLALLLLVGLAAGHEASSNKAPKRANYADRIYLIISFAVIIDQALLTSCGFKGLQGAIAGYLMLGLATGIVFNVMEDLIPGSLHAITSGVSSGISSSKIDFISLNYFAFSYLSTVVFGDIVAIITLGKCYR